MASIAHEVNQPLAAVVTNGNAAMRWLERAVPDSDEAKAAIRRMIEEGTRAGEIITRTRAMAVKGNRLKTRFCVNEMLEDTIEIVRRQVAALGSELELMLKPDMPTILADRIQLQQVAINLIINAAQAMAAQEDRQRRVVVSSGSSHTGLTVEVADTGPGIAEGEADRLFTAFYTTKAEGMGMGLSVTRSIVESHGGTIVVGKSDLGGASFMFTVPADEPLMK
jgi:C4-dicarboxylate-specific signal transduction histidine kinase